MSRWNLAWLLGIVAVASLGFAVSQSAPSREKDKDYELVRLVVDVLDEVDHNYVRELPADAKRKLVEDMINGGLERLDPHSAFINPKRVQAVQQAEQGQVRRHRHPGRHRPPDRGMLTVISPMVGTPAYEAGVLAGDIIVKIDGKSTENMHVSEAVDLIQGDPGQKITLTVLPRGHQGAGGPGDDARRDRGAQRAGRPAQGGRPAANGTSCIDKDNKIAYIRLTDLQRDDGRRDAQGASRSCKKEGVRGLVIDLRNNPGGLLQAAVEISDLFLTEGRIVSTKGRNQQGRGLRCQAGRHAAAAGREVPDGHAGQQVQRQRQRDRVGRPAGPQAGRHHRRAQLRQGQRAEHHPRWRTAPAP